jgi:hypothetical protein
MNRVLLTRPASRWRQVSVTVLLWVAQMILGLVVLALRTARAALTLTIACAGRAEQLIAARTGRPALSDTGIAALAAAFAHEFHAAYRGTPTR